MLNGASNVRKVILRLLALPLILAVFILGAEAVSHSHGFSHDEDHCTCQICHVGHAGISQPIARSHIKVQLAVASFTPFEKLPFVYEWTDILSVPRAPPA